MMSEPILETMFYSRTYLVYVELLHKYTSK